MCIRFPFTARESKPLSRLMNLLIYLYYCSVISFFYERERCRMRWRRLHVVHLISIFSSSFCFSFSMNLPLHLACYSRSQSWHSRAVALYRRTMSVCQWCDTCFILMLSFVSRYIYTSFSLAYVPYGIAIINIRCWLLCYEHIVEWWSLKSNLPKGCTCNNSPSIDKAFSSSLFGR